MNVELVKNKNGILWLAASYYKCIIFHYYFTIMIFITV